MESVDQPMRRGGGMYRLLSVVLLVVIVVAVGWIGYMMVSGGNSIKSTGFGGKDVYHATFLTNGQVYFSNIENPDSQYVELGDIYYLRVQQALQPRPDGQQQPAISLVKLGNELHGPEDVMLVNRDQILFIEPLKEESNVVSAIRKDKAEGGTQ